MTNEELILERLDRIEAQLAPISQTAGGIKELRDDLVPLSGQAFRFLTRELEDVESSFQLEDLMELLKRSLRSVKHIKFALDQMDGGATLAFTGSDDRLVYPTTIETFAPVLGQQRRMRIQNSVAISAQHVGPEFFHVAGQKYPIHPGFIQFCCDSEIAFDLIRVGAAADMSCGYILFSGARNRCGI